MKQYRWLNFCMLPKDLRYVGYDIDSDAWGTKMHSFGLWYCHFYWTFGDHYGD